jgi:hypothetical protein
MNQRRNKDIDLLIEQFNKIIYVDLGIEELNERIKEWYNLSWEEFKRELFKSKIMIHANLLNDLEYFFHHQKKKVLEHIE